MINLLCFADDMVLIAPSWDGLQLLIDTLYILADEINMSFNTRKTVCMVFNPSVSRKIVSRDFPVFTVGNTALKFVSKFKYLGNIITDDGLPSCTTVIHNFNFRFRILISTSTNVIVKSFVHFSLFCICFYGPRV